MMGAEALRVPAPVDERAFDHPETRAVWERTHRKLRRRLTMWWILCFPSLLAVGSLLDPAAGKTVNTMGGIAMIAWILGYPTLLYFCTKSLRCLKRMRRVLEAYPWRLILQVHRPPGVRDTHTAAVHLQHAEDQRLTGLVSVWNPVRTYRRWPRGMEYGAWYAGDTIDARTADSKGRGVLTLPGIGDLFSVTHRYGHH
ncbi:hypothetical protein [Streptomyces sp. NBC_00299]|uniref:hypothetical protein n=1 Tax=Streptomyces sp. NBC_00299 TaxID=2975705 RepID=UPI002E283C26|nr:hypothetical protein [Streptomyces sp. NBC_00299]